MGRPDSGFAPEAAAAEPASAADHLARGFAAQVEAWCARQGADAATRRVAALAARAVSLATSQGHVCLALRELAPALAGFEALVQDRLALRATLVASGVVGTPGQDGAWPLILDGEDRLYLHRYFDFERRLARRLVRAASIQSAAPLLLDEPVRRMLGELFRANEARLGGRVDWQKIAAAMALRGRLTVISGGPGTGKTTTVVNLLACLLAQEPQCRIALAAPTGKAAARMMQAIGDRATHLPAELRARLPAEAYTVHRLLGATPARQRFEHHAGNPLAIDVLVVDEASMLGLALATRLLEAVPESARIILLGDKDQLCAVESGAVFAELSADPGLSPACRAALAEVCARAPGEVQPPQPERESPLRDATVWFTQNFRFEPDSGIGRLASYINGARSAEAALWLSRAQDESVRWIEDGASRPTAATLQRMHDGYGPYLQAVLRDPRDPLAASRAFGAFRVLCAVHEGPRGTLELNDRMVRQARRLLAPVRPQQAGQADEAAGSPWFVGRPVMVLRNDYVLKLYNGDVGIALLDDGGRLMVAFPDPGGGFRWIAPVRLPEHQDAFALTIHKSQGSEFEEVLVLLPHAQGPVLTRELLYTAVTRASRRVTLACGAGVLAGTIQACVERHTGLLARLREALTPQASAPTPGQLPEPGMRPTRPGESS